ncbi:MAG: vWA domain-containing protein [Gemmatimonadaceae bacterium]
MTALTQLFDRPLLLVLALLLPAVGGALVVAGARRRRVRLARLGTPAMIARLAPAASLAASGRLRALLLGGALLFAGVAFAGPRWGLERSVVRGEGVDVVLALDASLSMLATDERPSRLERVKQEVRRLRADSRGDRFALVAFAGRSYILSPLTVDNGALDLFLDNLDPSVVGQAGSSLARAIRQGTDLLLSTKTGSDRALVVMSDGEAFEPLEDVVAAAQRAREGGISLVTVGFGTPQGATIPLHGDGAGTVKRDEEGNVVVTRYTPDLLRAAAQAANGTFIDAGAADKATRIRRALQQLRGQSRAVEAGTDRTPRFQLFLIPAVLLLLLDTLLAERRGRRLRGPAAAATADDGAAVTERAPSASPPAASGARGPAAALLLALSLALPRAARADDATDATRAYRAKQYARAAALWRRAIEKGDRTPETLYNYGTALLAADSLKSAAEALERAATASKDAEVRYRALFNLGLSHLRVGLRDTTEAGKPSLDAALAAYKKVLLARAGDRDAKWNYELALRKKKEQSGGGGGGGGGGGQSPSPKPDPSSRPQQPAQRPQGGLGEQRADELLNSAAREERDVQGKKQQQSRPEPPPGGKDW